MTDALPGVEMPDEPTALPDQRDRLRETDWDVLCVLDALRWDYWTDIVGGGEPVWSPGAATIEWVPEFVRAGDFSETVCVTANPEVTRRTHESVFHERDDIWERKWEYINGFGTVDPDDVTSAVVARRTVLEPDQRVYAHYAQPHGPYPVHDPPLGVMRNNPYAADVDTDNVADEYQLGEQIIMDPMQFIDDSNHWLTSDILRSAYRANVEWVWDAIQPLIESQDTVVVTADHGDFLAEDVTFETADGPVTSELYGHPPGVSHPTLRVVPWVVFD